MRRIMTVGLLLIAAVAFATGTTEVKPTTITVLHGGDVVFDGWTRFGYATEQLLRDYPGTIVELMKIDLSDGSTLTMDAMLAAGTAPNVYIDFIGRASKYIVPEYARDLRGLVRDLDKYRDLGPYTRGGAVLALPEPGEPQGMAINMEIMREIGFTPTWNWTIADFLRMAELVKQRYGGQKWATGMFAANQSGDYLINNWFAAFGVKYYANGYGATTIDRGGAEVYRFFQTLERNGYIPPNSATLTDDDYVIQWAKGDLAATGFFESWMKPYFDTVVAQGLGKPFEYQFFPFPGNASTYMSSSALIVHNTGTPADAIAARWGEYANSAKVQGAIATLQGVSPSRSDAVVQSSNPRRAETSRIAAENGIFDVGLTMPFFARTRPQQFPILQRVLRLEVTPEVAIAEYAARLNAAIRDE
jgi:ABC-type glycerol-3-phosphate transport system substrate-binding protein